MMNLKGRLLLTAKRSKEVLVKFLLLFFFGGGGGWVRRRGREQLEEKCVNLGIAE